MKFFLIFFVIFMLIPLDSLSRQRVGRSSQCRSYNTDKSFFCVTVLRVYDGDTIFIDIPNTHPLIGKNIGVRFRGIDTPEIRGKTECERRLAYKARDLVINMIAFGKQVDLRNVSRPKHFRILADVYVDKKNVSDVLLRRGLARSYWGKGKRSSWADSCSSIHYPKSPMHQ